MSASGAWDRIRKDLREEEAESPASLPKALGRYAVLREISRTGSSVVYLAQDPELRRTLAVKVLREDCVLPDFIRRFKREGEIAASLRHPNLITIHDVGSCPNESGVPVRFIAMDYVPGGTVAGRSFDARRSAELLATVAEAVDFAHGRGIIHRDLKPGNILLDGDGNPVVTDFGLAKSEASESSLTRDGSVMGTPQYMAPEQVRGEPAAVGVASDVYALGAILYELLTGRPPFAGSGTALLFERILKGDPPMPRGIDPGIPRDLETIALKALEAEPARRYPSAGDFARELRRYLRGEPIEARAMSMARRAFRKGLRSRPLVVLEAAIIMGILLLGLAEGKARLEKRARIREELLKAQAWVREKETWKARDAFRTVLVLDPGNAEALQGFDRAEADLRVRTLSRKETRAPASLSWGWVPLGTSASGTGLSSSRGEASLPALAIDGRGHPVVAWRDLSKDADEIFLRRWDGSSWVELVGSASGGGLSNTIGQSRFPSLALDARDNPVVAWDDKTEDPVKIYIRRWTGSAWAEYGGSLSISGPGRPERGCDQGAPSLALDREGHPVVAWQEKVQGKFAIYLRRWNGGAWVELGGSGSGSGLSDLGQPCERPFLALDRSGRPAVAWIVDFDHHCQVAFRRWNGSAWEDLGTRVLESQFQGASREENQCSVVLESSGIPIVAWRDHRDGPDRIRVRRWGGSAWADVGGELSDQRTPSGRDFVSIGLDSKDRPVVAWMDRSTSYLQVCVRRWDGSDWVELAGSGTSGGISRTSGNARNPVLRLDRTGNPVVAWVDGSAGHNEIYLRRFFENPPTELRQLRGGGSDPLSKGEFVPAASVVLAGTPSTVVPGASVRLEVELAPVGAPFTGVRSTESPWVKSGFEALVRVRSLSVGSKRWQARTVDTLGMVSPWVSFGGDSEDEADFRVEPPR